MKDKRYLLVLYYKNREVNYHCENIKEVVKILDRKRNTNSIDFDIYSYIGASDQLEFLQIGLKRFL